MILAVESKRGHSSKTQVLAQEDVLHRVTEHRLHELRSSNPDLCTFADYISMTEGTWTLDCIITNDAIRSTIFYSSLILHTL